MTDSASRRPSLGLLGGFEIEDDGEGSALPLSAQRVVAFVALHDRALLRIFVAGSLWLDTTEERASANLRTALWRLRRAGGGLVRVTTTHVALAPSVRVDLHAAAQSAHRALHDLADDRDLADLCGVGELLPDWYDDWVVDRRERFRQLRVHALEALCQHLTASGRYGDALDAALSAVAIDPLRESAQRALIRTYIAEGNSTDAMRQYRVYRDRLDTEIGLEPSWQMRELVDALPVRSRARRGVSLRAPGWRA